MHPLVVDKPYRFIPAHRSNFWPSLIQRFRLYEPHLRKREGVEAHEIRHVDRLRVSLAAGNGILLTPNHTRTADPMVMGWLAKEAGTHLYAMASWHLFLESRLMGWAIPRMGAFSVLREGVDRQSMSMAIELLEQAERPLIVFPEGGIARTNDRLQALLDIAPLARAAAKRRAKRIPGAKVVVHPIAIKYLFSGDLQRAADDVLTRIEHRLTWRPQRQLALLSRVGKVGKALLGLKELEYLGQPYAGTFAERLARLIDHLLGPLETEWLGAARSGPVVPRVKTLRVKILPALLEGPLEDAERQRRLRQLDDVALAQQLACYPPDYLLEFPSVDRYLETIERFEEDLMETTTVHGSLKVIVEVGEAIPVNPERDRTAEVDPLMARIECDLQGMLDRLSRESRLV